MKLIIDIPDEEYKTLSELSEKEKVNELSGYERVIANGIPYVERAQGEWTDLSTDGRHTGWIACSVCGQEPPNESNLRTNFCPNCGASMRKGDAE